MVVTEESQNIGVLGRGKYTSMKANNKWRGRTSARRNDKMWNAAPLVMETGGYEPPRLTALQQQTNLKRKRIYPRKVRAPRAPYNTSSFIMRAKRSGDLASIISPVTPAILPTPVQSPSPRYREGLVDEVNKEWGVDGYGSMNGLIRLRSMEEADKFDTEFGTGESKSDVEQDSHAESVQQLEQRIDSRIDHGLSRFEELTEA